VSRYHWQAVPGYAGHYYARGRVNGKHTSMHNFVMRRKGIDHIDGNPLDNRKSNLRPATNRQNQMNRRHRKGQAPFKGIKFCPALGKWCARIQVRGKSVFLGYFTTGFIAAAAYDHAARRYFKDRAALNFPNERRRFVQLQGKATLYPPVLQLNQSKALVRRVGGGAKVTSQSAADRSAKAAYFGIPKC